MKITKFAQSCIMIESEGQKILIDPGAIGLDKKTIQKWIHPDFILITHKHFDHFDENAVNKIVSNKTIIYASSETAKEYPNTKFEIIKKGNKFNLGKVKVEVVKGIHGHHALMPKGKEVKEAIGYILELEGKKLYHTGDTISFQNDYKCNILFVPFNNHGVCMGPFEAALFAKETNAELIIPIHQNNEKLPADIEKFKIELEKNKLNYKFLEIGESIEF